MKIALVGNPNCGKTTLFNFLTGTYNKTGNWTGVTVTEKEYQYKKNKEITVVDLPGIYTESGQTADETVVSKYLTENKPDYIINVIDGNVYLKSFVLTDSLIKYKIPMIVAVNYVDELDGETVEKILGVIRDRYDVNAIGISAKKRINTADLIETCIKTAKVSTLTKTNAEKTERATDTLIKEDTIAYKRQKLTDAIDKIVLNKYLSIPLLFVVLTAVYYLSNEIGKSLALLIGNAFDRLNGSAYSFLIKLGVGKPITDLITDAVIKGIGTVICFFPQVTLIFLFLTFLEEVGYASRITYLLDKILNKIGMGGKSVLPLFLSCGCAVSGILSTRIIKSEKERQISIYLSPFMPCGAKMIVFGWFSVTLFGGNPLIATSMYFISVFSVITGGLILKRLIKEKDDSGFIIELPTYRLPPIKESVAEVFDKTKDFAIRAGSVVLSVSVLLWLLSNFGFTGYVNGNVNASFLYYLGNGLKYIFYPIGFGDWKSVVGLLSGLFAREGIVESLTLLSEDGAVFESGINAYCFMVFALVSPPCLASIDVARKELNSKKKTIFMLIFQFSFAYSLTFIILHGYYLIKYKSRLIFSVILVIIISTLFVASLKRNFKCKKCSKCGGKKKCQKNSKANTIL